MLTDVQGRAHETTPAYTSNWTWAGVRINIERRAHECVSMGEKELPNRVQASVR